MGTIATAIQQFVATLKTNEAADHDPPEWYKELDAAATAFIAELPALTSSGDTLATLATRNANDGDVDLNNHEIANLLAGEEAGDAVNLTQLQALTKGTGATKVIGTAVLSGGTVTVSNANVHTGSVVILTRQVTGGTPGHLTIGTVTDATSFVINSSSGTDTSTIGWLIVNPT